MEWIKTLPCEIWEIIFLRCSWKTKKSLFELSTYYYDMFVEIIWSLIINGKWMTHTRLNYRIDEVCFPFFFYLCYFIQPLILYIYRSFMVILRFPNILLRIFCILFLMKMFHVFPDIRMKNLNMLVCVSFLIFLQRNG